MDKQYTKGKIGQMLYDIFCSVGIYVDLEDQEMELQFDSLQFVTVSIQIEEIFMVSIYEHSNFDSFRSFADYVRLIEQLCVSKDF